MSDQSDYIKAIEAALKEDLAKYSVHEYVGPTSKEAIEALYKDRQLLEPVNPQTVADLKSVINAIPKPTITELRLTPAEWARLNTSIPKEKPYERNVVLWALPPELAGIPIILDVNAPPLAEQLEALKNKENNE